MNLFNRLKLATKILIKGTASPRGSRTPIPALTPEQVAEARAFFPLDKFFVYGHARSGTTMLMYLLDTHPEIHCSRQAHFFSRAPFLSGLVADPEVAEWLARGSVRWNRGGDLAPVVMRAAADFILERDARTTGAKFVGDKSPNSINDGAAVTRTHQIYPDAKIIYIVRDGRDTTLSHRFQAFIDATQHLGREDFRIREAFEQDPDSFRSPDKSLFSEKQIREYAAGWVRNIATTSAQGQALYPGQYYEVRYEDLLADPFAEMQKIYAFMGADTGRAGLEDAVLKVANHNRDAAWQEKKAGEMASAIPKGQAGSWQEFFSTRDKEIFDEVAGAMLKKWGYGE